MNHSRSPRDNHARALDALQSIPASVGYHVWVRIGMALHALGMSFDHFNAWSAAGDNYKGSKDARTTWNSFRADGGVTGATLFSIAKEYGWCDRIASNGAALPLRAGAGLHAVRVADGDGSGALPQSHAGAPIRHRDLGLSTACWHYYHPNGALAFDVARFDPPGSTKTIRPRHLHDGRIVWKMPSGVRPLYNVLLLRESPDAPVLVCEGEKAADAAAQLVPDAVVVTSSGGAMAPKCTDWSPLHGRQVAIWADHDDAGKSYADAVSVLVRSAGARLLGRIDPLALMEVDHLSRGWDAADALARGLAPRPLAAYPLQVLDEAQHVDDFTEDGMAREFARLQEGSLLYCTERKRWLAWSGAHWSLRNEEIALTRIREMLDPYRANHPRLSSIGFVGAVEKFARITPSLQVHPDDCDQDLELLATPHGVVDLRTGEMRAALPEDRMTRMAGCSPAPPGTPAHAFRQFLDQMCEDDHGKVRLIQQMMGLCLTGDVSHQRFFFLYGYGNNGKSLLIRVLRALTGTYCAHGNIQVFLVSRQDRHPTELAALQGARFVTTSEPGVEAAWNTANVKDFTGEDPISARAMNKDFSTYIPQCTLVFQGNHKPKIPEVGEDMRRRLVLIPLMRKVQAVDPHLFKAMEASLPEIMRFAVDGLLDYYENGLVMPPSVQQATDAYLREEDMPAAFLEDMCVSGGDYSVDRAHLGSVYVRYLASQGATGSAKQLFAALVKKGYVARKTNGTYRYIGLGLRDEVDKVPPQNGELPL